MKITNGMNYLFNSTPGYLRICKLAVKLKYLIEFV